MTYDPKTSSVTTQYLGNKNNNSFYWITSHPWGNFPYTSQIVTTMNPVGSIVYEDGTSPAEPVP